MLAIWVCYCEVGLLFVLIPVCCLIGLIVYAYCLSWLFAVDFLVCLAGCVVICIVARIL